MKIKRVEALEGGEMLDIQLESGHTLLLDITELLKEARFESLRNSENLLNPLTDGLNVIWKDGFLLSEEEIMDMVQDKK